MTRTRKLPTMEDTPVITAIDAAADAYVTIRNKRMQLTLDEHEKREALGALMHEHELTTYTDHEAGYTVEILSKEKLRVRSLKDDENEE